ncbi:hypothetical protein BCR34DRAFT_607123 [Clohesyomyces aquaticus]|uniref:Uncharacterized protein n=1 Tax=Clohesyomyces aquaticus TaxID=1231657 RepID=A0A1Y1YIJ6_9PLEO|nr:hypothetical protein BCR34DRAFT_607123 [Clohesyomyces aquaticus]
MSNDNLASASIPQSAPQLHRLQQSTPRPPSPRTHTYIHTYIQAQCLPRPRNFVFASQSTVDAPEPRYGTVCEPKSTMELKEKAAIGIGVPLGVLVIFIACGMAWANFTKKRRLARGEVEELEMGKDANVPAPRQIRWNPYG